MLDLFHTLQDLQAWGVSLIAQTGLQFDLRSAQGQRVEADRYAEKVLKLVSEGQSYREISHRLGLSKNTVLDIVKRERATAIGAFILPSARRLLPGSPSSF